MLKQRALSALVFVPLVLALAYIGGLPFNLFWIAILAFAGFEFVRMARGAGYRLSYPITIGMIVLIAASRSPFGVFADIYLFPILVFVAGAYGLWQFERGDQQALWNTMLQIFAVVYLGILGSFAITLNATWLSGNWWLLLAIGLVWLVDAGAYLIGSRFGKRVILPRLSPKKTLEGFLGGVLVGVLTGAVLGWLLRDVGFGFSPLIGAILGGLIGLVAFYGDALMSLIKRSLGVKDSGKLLPGHGGVLDRLDSMLWAFVVVVITKILIQ